ncbi:hypothetical protein CYMTET_28491 [Cymbomonas tetramitiformis]|uniref:Non-structural maintenance of chromosomes element 1 homolog n=1 Tax=Cymbomonas tetramitiformis TaxID=36881 RepID=A0AAE0FMT0_9CHLO|nr:hypothetical protein CYMTET_28491 [Cymbomonas tetramitiformis]
MVVLQKEHHCFIQMLLAKGYMKEAEARDRFKTIAEQNHDRNFDEFWGSINSEIGYTHLALRRLKFPHDGQLYIGIVNTEADEPSKLGTSMSAVQLKYFSSLVSAIATDEIAAKEGVTSMAALNVNDSAQQSQPSSSQAVNNLNRAEREASLQQLRNEGWLFLCDGRYTLGVRTFLELSNYLHSIAPEPVRKLWQDLV